MSVKTFNKDGSLGGILKNPHPVESDKCNDEEEKTLPVVKADDARFVTNKLPSSVKISLKSGVEIVKDGMMICPAQISHNHAVIQLDSRQYEQMLNSGSIVVPCGVNEQSNDLPSISQRAVTKPRIVGIQEGWKDVTITPTGHLEKIEIFAFGVSLQGNGTIYVPRNALLALSDGAGRSGSHFNNPAIAKERGIIWQLSIDLSGEKSRMLQTFRKQRDAKKLSKGTLLGVDAHLLDELEKLGEYEQPTCFNDRLFPAHLARCLFNDYRNGETYLRICSWASEAGRQQEREGNGKITSLYTVFGIKKTVAAMKASGHSVKDMPKVLDFGFRQFWRLCDEAKTDALENQGNHYHFHSSLGVKVIVMLTLKFYKRCGGDPAMFERLLDRTVTEYYRNPACAKDFTCTGHKKKLCIDDLFVYNIFFNSEMFNGGEVNAGMLLSRLDYAATAAANAVR